MPDGYAVNEGAQGRGGGPALKRLLSGWRRRPMPRRWAVDTGEFVWALGSLCALNRVPFDPQLVLKQYPPPHATDGFIHAARSLGFKVKAMRCGPERLAGSGVPFLALVAPATAETGEAPPPASLALVTGVGGDRVSYFAAGTNTPAEEPVEAFSRRHLGVVLLVAKQPDPVRDADAAGAGQRDFGFSWFLPELLKHRRVWRDVLVASLVIQLLALGTPLFTQVIIDKVVVHRTESTLMVIAVGMVAFMIFSALLTWIRQYLVLHTGNRVDAVLAAAVFDHLFRLPPRYFEHRPTGVIAARLQGVETIREFIASAAVTVMLDLPFLLVFVAIMLWYSLPLTLIVLAILGIVAVLSLAIAPVLQRRLNEQFLLGARNQAFLTEYIAGVETVKSLQMEPQIKARFSDYMAQYLFATFRTRQLSNTYNVASGTLEQLMTLLVLVTGAWLVMHSRDFSIGMLVAFQMFAGRLSQPMMRLVGLWQQFQQARLSVRRLGDVMNAPPEPYSLIPARLRDGRGLIEIDNLSFRHAENLPYLYQGFDLAVPPGSVVAVMGPSGSGKSTLAKLLQGFYRPADGRIRIDGTDIQNLSANELRHYFGVVPQETVLFSGTIYDNLIVADPHATFERIVEACRMAEIHEVVEQLPNGYQTEIGERGVGLSGGQRQRLAIARALLKRPRILIFDEATSNLDPETAEHFAATINRLRGTVTMIFIAHVLPRSLQVDSVIRIGRDHQPGAAV